MVTRKDFEKLFDRNDTTFVHATKKDRLKWEDDHNKEEGYCMEVLGKELKIIKERPEVIELGASFARTLISTISPKFVSVRLRGGLSYTDGKSIALNTDVYDDSSLTKGKQIDVFCGFAVHEALHIAHSDFKKLKELPEMQNKTFSFIQNVIEDERIEIACGERYPGYTKYLEQTKEYMFDTKYQPNYEIKSVSDKLLDLFFKVVRFPKHIADETFSELGDLAVGLKNALTPYPVTQEEAIECTHKVYGLLKEEFDKRSKKDKEDKEKGDSGEEGEEGETAKDPSFEDDSKVFSEALKKLIESSLDPTTVSVTKMSEFLRGKEAAISKVEAAMQVFDLEGSEFEPLYKNTRVTFQKDNKALYKESLSRVGFFASSLSRLLTLQSKDMKIVNKGTRSGFLDTSKLVEGYQGVDTVYERHGVVKTNKVAMILVVDESYSMQHGGGTKIRAARDCAILLNEALQRNREIELFVYGHTADDGSHDESIRYNDIQVYKEQNHSPKFALGAIHGRWNNRDGYALREIAKRVRVCTQRPAVMFWMADGMPSAYGYNGRAASEDVIKAVKELKAQNITVVCISIEDGYDARKMFEHVVPLTDMSTLTRDLGFVVRKVAKELLKVETTIF